MGKHIEESYRCHTPRSQAHFERARKVMPGGAKGVYFYQPYPLTMERGEGCYLYDADGRKLLDCVGHHTALVLGNGHPAVMAAVRQQLEGGLVFSGPTGVEAALAEEMVRRVPALERVRFCCSGTEATLHAIRLARGFSGKPRIAKFEGGYHGSHDVVEISVAPSLDRAGPRDAPHSVPTAGGISPHAAEEVVVLPYDDEAAVERLVRAHRDELACVICDAKTGILETRRQFVQAVRRIAGDSGVLFILDEVVGFRLARGGQQEYYGIAPDLATYGKAIGGGFPVGGFGGRADIMDLLDNTRGPTGFFQSGTFSAHPVTMAAGLATLRQLTPEAFAHLNGLGERLRAGLEALRRRTEVPMQAVVAGSLFAIHFTAEKVADYRSFARADKGLAHRVFLALLEEGYYLSHWLGFNALSLPMTAEHVDGLLAGLERAIGRAVADGRST
ncbi:MAG: aminotransferase class III-fold pyridoxal phosphate-dependent enzyme [Candidatus Latescibacterota bacterium]